VAKVAARTSSPPASQRSSLQRELDAAIDGEVRFDAGSRALYATDLSIYRQVPIGVVVPRTVEDIVQTVEICRAYGAPLLGRGGGTSLVGQCTNEAVVLDCSKYLNRILELDAERKLARVQPGVVCDDLKAAAENEGLTWGPDPATHQYANVGGMIGNNSCGVHSVLTEFYGGGARTADNLEALEVVTYDGLRLRVGATSDDELEQIIGEGGRRAELYAQLRELRDRYARLIRERYPQIPRRVSGYNLDELLPERGFHVARALAGTESTCAITLEATLRLVDNPTQRALLLLGYPDQYVAADHIAEIREQRPIGIECVDHTVTDNMRRQGMHTKAVELYPEGDAWLLVEFGGDTTEEAAEKAHALERQLANGNGPATKLIEDDGEQKLVWLVRESSIGASRIPRKLETWPTFEDSSVAPEKLGAYLRDFKKLLDKHGLDCVFFGHYGQGCAHTRIGFDLKTAEGVKRFRDFHEEATDLVLSYGGSLSGEHGDGQAHGWALEKMYGRELIEAFREYKRAWDPDWKLNPGKKIDAYPPDSNLRLGPAYRPAQPKTHFSFHQDGFSFAAATERCFGVGLCRKHDSGTMCPSYMATLEETHTTRGRAHLLFEMLRGEVIGRHGWRDEAVKEALDLCLACKGCKGECPVQVDIATYKAEFLAHYYARRIRPRIAYALGLIPWWARLAERAPRLANAMLGETLAGRLLKRVARIAPERELPRFADETFKAWFRRRPSGDQGDERVILWPDTFTNHFQPQIARAAVEVLESAGLRVEVPQRPLCCGRTLYDFGMLRLAKRWLEQILDELRPAIADGVPLVGLEPSCLAVFREELPNLLPHDEDAKRLSSQAFLLSEFLERKLNGWQPPSLAGKALVHGHCHHKALMKLDDEEAVLTKLGLDFEVVDSGCCGMAGSFGYHAGEHYDVSMKAGERVLLPAVRAADANTLIVADGFSCRGQITHATGREALHLAEVIQLALRERVEPRPRAARPASAPR
jgi:FAD/FMN-containing dehydrogenase/Fe-S oxidoreductase